jgi:hypothetical protein
MWGLTAYVKFSIFQKLIEDERSSQVIGQAGMMTNSLS